MNPGGIFPKWIDPFDRWHVRLLPPILIGLSLALILAPGTPPIPPGLGSARVPQSLRTNLFPGPLTLGSAPSTAQPVPAIRPTRIESPFPNSLFWKDRLGDVEGTAEPGSLVRLFHGDKLLSQTVASADGRFRFQLMHFPPGTHVVRVIATLGRAAEASEPVTFVVKAERAPKPAAETAKPAPAASTKQRAVQPKSPAKPKQPVKPANKPAKPQGTGRNQSRPQ